MSLFADVREAVKSSAVPMGMADVAKQLGASTREQRLRISRALSRLAENGSLVKSGPKAAMRYSYLRGPQKPGPKNRLAKVALAASNIPPSAKLAVISAAQTVEQYIASGGRVERLPGFEHVKPYTVRPLGRRYA